MDTFKDVIDDIQLRMIRFVGYDGEQPA